jgi:hypothetical protein
MMYRIYAIVDTGRIYTEPTHRFAGTLGIFPGLQVTLMLRQTVQKNLVSTLSLKLKVLYDWRSVSQSVCLGVGHSFGAHDQILLFPFFCFALRLGRPLWREDGSVVCSAICQWSESRRTHITVSTGFPFRRLLRLAGITVEVFLLASTRDISGHCRSRSYFTTAGQSVSQYVLVSSTLVGPIVLSFIWNSTQLYRFV